MSITVTYSCDGCSAVSAPVVVRRRFESFSGKGYGFGRFFVDSVVELAPQDWCAFDLLGCTYCPECVKELYGADVQEEE